DDGRWTMDGKFKHSNTIINLNTQTPKHNYQQKKYFLLTSNSITDYNMKKLLLLFLCTVWMGASVNAQCPTAINASANVTQACSGEFIKLNASVDQGDVTYSWMTEVGSPVPTPNNWLIANKSCRAIVQSFIVTATCNSNPSIKVTAQVNVTTYPTDISAYITPIPGGCTAMVSVDPSCAGTVQAGAFTAEQGQSGTADIYIDWLGGGNCVQDFTVPVAYNCGGGGGGGGNSNPTVALDDNIGVYPQGTSADFTGGFLLSNDLGDNISIVEVCSTSTNGGTIVNNGNGNYTYIPNPNFSGLDSFCYTITGADGGSWTANVFVFLTGGQGGGNINAANDDLGTLDAGTPVTFTGTFLLGNDTGDGIFVTNVCSTSANGGTIVDNGNGTYTYTPPSADYVGTDSFCYSIGNSSGATGNATVFVNYTEGQSTLEILNDNIGTHPEGTSVTFSGGFLLSNDSGDNIFVSDVCSPSDAGGTITDNGNGTYTYTPPSADYVGTDAFCYSITDANGNTASGIVFVTFTDTGVVVDANNDDLGDFEPGQSITFTAGQLLGNDSGVGITIFSVCTTTSAGGTVTDNGDGTYTYTPPSADFAGDDSFCYTITDGNGNTDTATISISFVEMEDLEAVNDDLGSYAVGETVSFTVGEILANDTGTGIFVLSVCSTSNAGGTITDNGNGLYTYNPPFGFQPGDADSFCYTIQDAAGNTDEASIIVSFVDIKFSAEVIPNCDEESGTFTLVVSIDSEFGDFIVEVIEPTPQAPVSTILNFAELGPFEGGVNVPYRIKVTQTSTGGTRILTGFVVDCMSQQSFIAEENVVCNSNGTFNLIVTIQGDAPQYEIEVIEPVAQAPFTTSMDVVELGPFVAGDAIPYNVKITEVSTGNSQTLSGLVLDCVTLPVELLTFDGEVQKDGNLLSWVTASEVNNDYFILERSTDGVFFESIAVLDGHGNSSDMHLYTQMDREALAGISYYRLLQTDFDGTTSIAGVISLKRSEVAFDITKVTPIGNYSEYTIGFTTDSNSPVTIELFNLAGQTVYSETTTANEGTNHFQMDLNTFAQGMYLLRLQQGQDVKVAKLVR
ncbi:MAG: cadherin-like domain-containing protein, partial [Chitinophagales bacterium]